LGAKTYAAAAMSVQGDILALLALATASHLADAMPSYIFMW